MRKLLNVLMVAALMQGLQVQAQSGKKTTTNRSAKDTIPSANRTDSTLIEELKENVLDNIPTVSLDDNDLSDGSSQNISSVLTAGRDPFFSAAAFNFSPARFRMRGYDGDANTTYMNGVPMENLDNGFTPFGLWGGLNDVLRSRDVSIGLRANPYTFGDIGVSTNMDVRASKQRRQTSLGYAYSNRNYTHRFSATWSSGLSKSGWAFTLSGSRRWADEGYVPGTYYNGWSWFVGIDKKIGQKRLLSLVAFAAPTENGKQGASVLEMDSLAGTHYYNPYWGYQNGKKRNANVAKTNQPYIILTDETKFNNNTTLVNALSATFGDRSSTTLDWYNAPDPRPDYYRYLPSYYAATQPTVANQIAQVLSTNENARQINWQNMYDVNRSHQETIQNATVNGVTGQTYSGLRSYYILGEYVTNTQKINYSSTFNKKFSNHFEFTAGVSYQSQNDHNYKRVNDLLGGQYFVDLNQFAQFTFPSNTSVTQNNLAKPNNIVTTGGTYGYDYNIHINKAEAWTQGVFKFNKVDFFLAAEASNTQFWRVGNMQNGLFPSNSLGKSDVYNFDNYGVKGGATYKLSGRNYFYVNGAYITKAPAYQNVFISPRTRDNVQDNITSTTETSVEGGYIMNAPKIKLRVSGYYTRIANQMDVLSFYDDNIQNFANYALSNIAKVHFGGELGFEARVIPNVTLNGAASVGRYYYDSRQNAVVTQDNTAAVVSRDIVYSQNYRVSGTPQEAYSLGIQYRSPKYWYVGLTANYFDQMWLEFNPIRRTYLAVESVQPYSKAWYDILNQTQLKGQYTVDFFGGYSWKLPKSWINKNSFLVFNAGVNNLLNNKDIVTGGYEQLRFDFQTLNNNKYPPKYYYAYGLNFFASATLRF
ncbi:TonB-dependent receptor [Russula earlei]|uniref:TonB-dependent receptor n=1 Tax=Russula earlei TaxID=71964 RepID=A0ACC0TU10_9AGAM|nr:TonB-dependent receptor [Russula earlei]